MHYRVLIMYLPFVHTARRLNRLDVPVNVFDSGQSCEVYCFKKKTRKPIHLKNEKVVTRYS